MRVDRWARCLCAFTLAWALAGCAQSVVSAPQPAAGAWTTPPTGAALRAQPRFELARTPSATTARPPCPPDPCPPDPCPPIQRQVVTAPTPAAPPRIEDPCSPPLSSRVERQPPCPPDPATVRLRNPAQAAARRFNGYVAYVAPDFIDAGVFYRALDRVSVGVVARQDFETEQLPELGSAKRPAADAVLDFDRSSQFSFGPALYVNLVRETRSQPSIGLFGSAYEFGTEDIEKLRTVALTASKRFPVRSGRSGLVRSFGVSGGGGYWWRSKPSGLEDTDGFVGWLRGDIQLARGFGVFAEISTQPNHCDGAYAIGLQWVSDFGVTFSISYYDCFAEDRDAIQLTPDAKAGNFKPTRRQRTDFTSGVDASSGASPRASSWDDEDESGPTAGLIHDE